MTRSTLGIALCALVLAVLPASAIALPAAKPPTSQGLAAAGVKLSWPLQDPTTTAKAGQRFTVRVHRGSARAHLRLVRVSGNGVATATVAARTLRSGGTFTATLPALAPASYALKVTAGGRTSFSWIVVPRPTPLENPCGIVDGTRPAATLTFAAGTPATVPVGTQPQVVVANTGDVCLSGTDIGIQRQTAPGVWEGVQPKTLDGYVIAKPAVLPAGYWGFEPGASATMVVHLPPDAVPGTYRVVYAVQPAVRDPAYVPTWQAPLPPPAAILTTPTFAVVTS